MEEYGSVAVVAVYAAPFAADKPYDYRIPSDMQGVLKRGMRVLVPFGGGNRKTEAIVLSLKQEGELKNLKSISRILDREAVLNDEMLRLVLWMRKRCFCTFYDAVKAILPTGIWYKTTTGYSLAESIAPEEIAKISGKSKIRRSILELFQKKDSQLTLAEIEENVAGKSVSKQLYELTQKGIILCRDDIRRGIGDKTCKMATLAVSPEEAEIKAGRSNIRKQVVRFLAGDGEASVGEICYQTGATMPVIQTLVKNGVLSLREIEVFRRPAVSKAITSEPLHLTEKQQTAFDGLSEMMSQKSAMAALLFGITGSGKTCVYIKLIELALSRGEGAILLVPEIALTPQMLKIFIQHFGDRVAVLHSALSAGERYDEWKRIHSGDATVVIGTRSAVFAPVQNLGIIIMDEEQEDTYKSENVPRYHARDIAKFRCVQNGALLLMGSATPSVESYYHATNGKYSLFKIDERYQGNELPAVIIDDMRKAQKDGIGGAIGPKLYEELKCNIGNHEQSILFLNRRGNSRLLMCVDCGYTPLCPHCSVSMTYHSANGRLMCHYCGHSEPVMEICPECHGEHIRYIGFGTQKVEQELADLFPGIKIVRMDADTTGNKGGHEAVLQQFVEEHADVLLGTQMVTKGLDFDHVTLVGVLDADMSLYSSDYRAGEKTFSLLTQVIGRAGRREKRGRAVIQTYTPDHPIILNAIRQDFEAFYEDEIDVRRALDCPPVNDLVVFTLAGQMENDVLKAGMRLAGRLIKLVEGSFSDIKTEVLGPIAAHILKINRRYRYKVSFRAKNIERRYQLISGILKEFNTDRKNKGVGLFVDINPTEMI